jgi:class 3 adenylate cyclase
MNHHQERQSASATRLEQLIEERLQPGADRDRIDERIWRTFGEDCAVMFTDLSGFSRRVARFGIIHFLQTIHESRKLLLPVVNAHDGILLKIEGDSFLVIFRDPVRALECAVAMQRALVPANEGRAEEDRILLCIGLGAGRVLRIGDADVWGAEVNAASRLGEDTAQAWEILVTEGMRAACGEMSDISFEPIDTIPSGSSGAWRVVYRLQD